MGFTPIPAYKRDGSSTAVATPHEVARMGEMRVSRSRPQLVLAWAVLLTVTYMSVQCSQARSPATFWRDLWRLQERLSHPV